MTEHKTNSCSLKQFSEFKSMPESFLNEQGVSDRITKVAIPYFLTMDHKEENRPVFVKLRTSLNGSPKYIFSKDAQDPQYHPDKLIPYGIWRIQEWLDDQKPYLIIVEGETDTLSAWYHNIPCIGISGASSIYKSLSHEDIKELLLQFDVIYVCIEPDNGGEQFLEGLHKLDSEIQDKIRTITMQTGCKDLSELHVNSLNTESFLKSFNSSLKDAVCFSWNDPEPLTQGIESDLSYPIEAFPSVIAEAVKIYQQYAQQPLPLIACSALSCLSLAAQGLVNVGRDKNLISPISLNVAIIARSGERKTSADSFMSRAIKEWQRNYIESHEDDLRKEKALLDANIAEKEGLRAKIKSKSPTNNVDDLKLKLIDLERNTPIVSLMPNLFLEDCTPEEFVVTLAEGWPSTSLWSDEGGIVIGGHGMKEESIMRYFALLNRLWDGREYGRKRRTAKSCIITGRRLTCSLMMQEVVLEQLLSTNNGLSRGIGFLARFLFTFPESTMGNRMYKDIDLDRPEINLFNSRITELLSIKLPTKGDNMNLIPPTLYLSQAAKEEWIKFHDEVERNLGKDEEFDDVADFAAKTADNAARIAANFWVFENGCLGEIDVSTMLRAIAVASWHLNEAKRVLCAVKNPQDVVDAISLLKWMKKRKLREISYNDILKIGPNAIRNKNRRDKAIEKLIDKGYAKELVNNNTKKLVLHPKYLEI